MELGLGSSVHSLVLKLTISYTELLLKMLVSYPLRIQLVWQLLIRDAPSVQRIRQI